MMTLSRRSLLALSAVAPFAVQSASARIRVSTGVVASCGAEMLHGTPVATAVVSDIPFDQAYLDTTIPYHTSALTLVDLAQDDLEDDRLIAIADAISTSFPADLEELHAMRERLFGDAEAAEATHEMMLISMGGVESCTDQNHMDFMKQEWVEKTYASGDDRTFSFVGMMVLLLEMEMHQHIVAVQLTTDEDVKTFAQRMIDTWTQPLADLKVVRGELISGY